jgi:hypothetical protein
MSQASSVRLAREAGERLLDGLLLLLESVLQALRRLVILLLGPRGPDLADLEGLEDIFRLGEARDVIPVLVRGRHDVEPPARPFVDVFDDLDHQVLLVMFAVERAAVEQHVEVAARLREGEQEAVAEALLVHPYHDLFFSVVRHGHGLPYSKLRCSRAKGSSTSLRCRK